MLVFKPMLMNSKSVKSLFSLCAVFLVISFNIQTKIPTVASIVTHKTDSFILNPAVEHVV
jgi:hypothetical protein